jgi:hypothetical protein
MTRGPWLMSGGVDRGLPEEQVVVEAGVPIAAVGVEDPEIRPPARRPEAVPGNHHLGPLADDVAAEPDPGASGELEPEPDRFGEGAGDARGETGRLEDDEEAARATGERGKPMETIRDGGGAGRSVRAGREIDEEEVDRPALEERAGHREALVERDGGHDDEPLEPDAAGDGLDGIEAPGEVEPRDDRALGLRLRGEAEGDRRLARGVVAADGEARAPRNAARAEDRVEGGEPGREDAVLGGRDDARGPFRLIGERHRRKGPDDLATPARSCRSPAGLETRESGRHVSSGGRHQVQNHRTDVL